MSRYLVRFRNVGGTGWAWWVICDDQPYQRCCDERFARREARILNAIDRLD